MALPFTPDPKDGAIELLRKIFGKVIDSIVGGNPQGAANASADMLGEALRFFNSGVLIFGGLIMLWVTIFGIANTANDGEALGKRWSTFYTPLRTLIAAMTLVPGASGYAMVQIILLMIVTYSIGFASNIWSAVVKYSVGQEITVQALKSITDDPNFEKITTDALRMRVCAAGVSKAVTSSVFGNPVRLTARIENTDPVTAKTNNVPGLSNPGHYQTKVYFKDDSWPSSQFICGSIVLENRFEPPTANSVTTAQVASSLNIAVNEIRRRYIESLFNDNNGTMTAIVNQIIAAAEGGNVVIDSKQVSQSIVTMKKTFLDSITTEVSKIVEKQNADVARKLSERGFIYAGSLYMEIIRIKDAVRNSTSSDSKYVEGISDFRGILSGDVEKAANAVLSNYSVIVAEVTKKTLAIETAQATANPKMPTIQTSFTTSDFTDGGHGVRNTINGYVNGASLRILDGAVHYLGDVNGDPVLRVKNLGDWLSTAASTLILAETAITASLEGLVEAARSGGIATGWLAGLLKVLAVTVSKLWSFISTALFSILYCGYFMGIWIPMIPFYVFALGIVGWLIFVGEMLCAGVLWAAAHLTPAREDSFIGSQTQGYLLVMSGFFRPALMIVGFVFSIAILNPLVQFINEAFSLAVKATQADSMTGLFSLAGFMIGYCFIMLSVFMMVFSLPQTFPDRILKWVGAGIGDMGEQNSAAKLEGAASGQARTAATGMAAHHAANVKKNLDDKQKEKEKKAVAAQAESKASAPEGISDQSMAISTSSEKF